MANVRIKTDNKWRNFKYGYELPKKWRKHFNWMTDEEYETNSFAKYKGQYYSLDEFTRIPPDMAILKGWSGHHPETYFSSVVIKISKDGEQYKIGRVSS